MTALATHRTAELEDKLDSLPVEFRAWRRDSKAESPLEKHYTQIRAVTRGLCHLVASVHEDVAAAAASDDVLRQAEDVEVRVLEVHRIWDFYRGKFAQRYVRHFAPWLLAADELAWRCYEPAQARLAAGAAREPPLVYLGGATSPITRPRGSSFVAEYVPGEELRTAAIKAALEALPIHVIGIPWSQVDRLQDMPIVAHEVGHDVEVDLGLTSQLAEIADAALRNAGVPEDRRRGWNAWLGEAFADVYATLALGPAFTLTLLEFLAGAPDRIKSEWQGGRRFAAHPPAMLRVLLNLAVLRLRGFAEDADTLEARWRDTYPSHKMQAYEKPDLDAIARAIVAGPYKPLNDGLTSLQDFGAEQHANANREADDALGEYELESTDARELVAAARLAYDRDRSAYAEVRAAERLRQRIEDTQGVGTRAAPERPDEDEVREARRARDEAAGASLAGVLSRLHAEEKEARDV